jgi:hypothetical protein
VALNEEANIYFSIENGMKNMNYVQVFSYTKNHISIYEGRAC